MSARYMLTGDSSDEEEGWLAAVHSRDVHHRVERRVALLAAQSKRADLLRSLTPAR
jgi:hypothetical protein